jgi:hypothetical protein
MKLHPYQREYCGRNFDTWRADVLCKGRE